MRALHIFARFPSLSQPFTAFRGLSRELPVILRNFCSFSYFLDSPKNFRIFFPQPFQTNRLAFFLMIFFQKFMQFLAFDFSHPARLHQNALQIRLVVKYPARKDRCLTASPFMRRNFVFGMICNDREIRSLPLSQSWSHFSLFSLSDFLLHWKKSYTNVAKQKQWSNEKETAEQSSKNEVITQFLDMQYTLCEQI